MLAVVGVARTALARESAHFTDGETGLVVSVASLGGALVGGTIGGVAGFAAGAASCSSQDEECGDHVVGALVGGTVGGVSGGLVGIAISTQKLRRRSVPPLLAYAGTLGVGAAIIALGTELDSDPVIFSGFGLMAIGGPAAAGVTAGVTGVRLEIPETFARGNSGMNVVLSGSF